MSLTRSYLPNLTALRGVAALLVVIYHSHEIMGNLHEKGVTHFTENLYLMVDLFFILSGFVIYHVYAASFEQGVTYGNYREFIIARFARIYPLHLVTLLCILATTLIIYAMGKGAYMDTVSQYMSSPSAFIGNLLMLQSIGFFEFLTVNAAAWSISAEWWIYLVFPFIVAFSPKIRWKNAFIWGISGVSLWLIIEFWLAAYETTIFPFIPSKIGSLNVVWKLGGLRGLAGFLVGMAICKLWSNNILTHWFSSTFTFIMTLFAWLFAAHFNAPDTLIVALFAILIWTIANGNPLIDKLLQTPFLQVLGAWSYSIYMWHCVLANIFFSVMTLQSNALPTKPPENLTITNSWIICVVWVTLTLITAWFSYHYIETPLRNRVKYWFGKKTISLI